MREYARRECRPVGPTLLVPGKLHGFRSWELGLDGDGVIRLSGFGGSKWREGGETTRAECLERGEHWRAHTSTAPAGNCSCGLYAFHPWLADPGRPLRSWRGLRQPLSVVGLIEAWGQVQLHGNGFRAQYARPVALLLLGYSLTSQYGRLVSQAAEAHCADVLKLPGLLALAEHCSDAGIGMSEDSVRSLLGKS